MIELSSGHIFASGSVKAITPRSPADLDPDTNCPYDSFCIVGVGFSIQLYSADLWDKDTRKVLREQFRNLHKEAIAKLLGNQEP